MELTSSTESEPDGERVQKISNRISSAGTPLAAQPVGSEDVKVGVNEAEMFSTTRNLCYIFAFQVFANVAMVLGFGIGLVVYVGQKGMSIQAMVNGYLLSFLAGTITQLYVGYLCDQPSTSAHGRRKPFVVTGFLVSAISMLALALPPSKDATALAGWFTLFYVAFSVGQAILTNPLTSWFIESSRDNQDYLRITTLCNPPALFVGGILALAGILISPALGGAGASYSARWRCMPW